MAYGTVKVDNITFTNGGSDQTITVSGIVQSISGNITATGTIQGATVIGTSTVSGATVTGNAGAFTTLTGSSAGFTTITGATVTGTTANFSSGVFTTQISGATVTGNVGSFTTITGGTVTLTSGVIASGTAANPSLSIVGDSNTGLYSPGADQLAISTSGTGRIHISSTGTVNIVGAGTPGSTQAVSFNGSAPVNSLVIDSSGRLLVGTTNGAVTVAGNFGSTTKQILFETSDIATFTGICTKSDGSGGIIALGKSRTGGIVSNNDKLGFLKFAGHDGVDYNSTGALISAEVDGTPGVTDMPGRLLFSTTADGAANPTERLRIASNGLHTINSQAHSGAALSTTAPAKLYLSTGTYTDTSTAASGTVTHGTIAAFDNPAIAATNATVTYTNASTVYIDGAPTGGTNVTVTNGFALYVNAGRTHFGGSVLSASPTDGVGYKTGAGGTVTQATSRTTGVTLNKICGAITLVSAAGSTAYQSFTVTNSTVAATDTIIVNQKSGTDLYETFVTAVAAGSFRITFATTGGTTTEQPVFNFSVIKAVTA